MLILLIFLIAIGILIKRKLLDALVRYLEREILKIYTEEQQAARRKALPTNAERLQAWLDQDQR